MIGFMMTAILVMVMSACEALPCTLLRLSGTNIDLPRLLSEDCPLVEKLVLENTELKEPNDLMMATHLRYIRLRNVSLPHLGDVLQRAENLTTVILENNNLSTVDQYVFSRHRHLTSLHITGNDLEILRLIDIMGLRNLDLAHNPRLKMIYTPDHYLVGTLRLISSPRMDFNILRNWAYLEDLTLVDCNLTDVSFINHGNNKIMNLDVSHNSLQNAYFDHLEHMMMLNLSSNGMQKLPNLSSLHNLHALYIDNNELRELPLDSLPLNSLRLVQLNHNRFNCSYLEDLVSALSEYRVSVLSDYVYETPNRYGIMCRTYPEFHADLWDTGFRFLMIVVGVIMVYGLLVVLCSTRCQNCVLCVVFSCSMCWHKCCRRKASPRAEIPLTFRRRSEVNKSVLIDTPLLSLKEAQAKFKATRSESRRLPAPKEPPPPPPVARSTTPIYMQMLPSRVSPIESIYGSPTPPKPMTQIEFSPVVKHKPPRHPGTSVYHSPIYTPPNRASQASRSSQESYYSKPGSNKPIYGNMPTYGNI